MTSIIFAIGLAYYSPVVLEPDVSESWSRAFQLPLAMNDNWRQKCESFRLWVSEDQGKTWKRHHEIAANGMSFPFTAPKDGHYWFALQIVLKDGKLNPPKVDSTSVNQKTYVNTMRRPVMRWHTVARPATPPAATDEPPTVHQLKRDVEELRTVVEQLRKRVAELEKERGPK